MQKPSNDLDANASMPLASLAGDVAYSNHKPFAGIGNDSAASTNSH